MGLLPVLACVTVMIVGILSDISTVMIIKRGAGAALCTVVAWGLIGYLAFPDIAGNGPEESKELKQAGGDAKGAE